jgi:hypothetical protein
MVVSVANSAVSVMSCIVVSTRRFDKVLGWGV